MGVNMTQVETIKVLLGESASIFSDSQLTVLISQAESEFKIYCNRSILPVGAESIINDMVIVKCNRMGTEGLQSQSFSGISDSFIDGYPANIINQLNRFRKIRTL